MLKTVLSGFLGLAALAALASTPAAAGGGCCDCYSGCGGGYRYGYYGYGEPVRAYYYDRAFYRAYYRRYDPRWQFAAAYYNPPRYSVRLPRTPVLVIERRRHWYNGW
jgi:hypothetical protein